MSHTGRLLVATPLIADPNFERTVVLLLAHGEEGALGVVLNRPSDTPVAEVVEAWAPWAAAPGAMFLGGPVAPSAVIGLARPDGEVDGFQPVVGDVGSVDLNRPPDEALHPSMEVRLFAGSAGWAPGQLDDELAEGAWWLADADPDDLLTGDPDGLWSRVLRRQPGKVAWFANHPADPSAN